MENWNYKTLSFSIDSGILGNKECDPQSLDTELNQWGEQGWELVSLVGIITKGWTGQIVATLKRKCE